MSLPTDFNAEDEQAVAWLKAVVKGDVQALEALYGLYSKPLFVVFLRIVQKRETAEEILQDTFLRIWDNAERYDPARSRPFSWILTIGRRIAIDRIRNRKKRVKILAKIEEHVGEVADKTSEQTTHDDELEIKEWVSRQLDMLPERQRQAIELAYFDGLSQKEISEYLELPLGTVKSDIRRGMLQLRKINEEQL